MFIYDMPYSARQRLVDILNVNDAWRELAGNLMGYDQVRLFFIFVGFVFQLAIKTA
jgi:hypothetical protein